MYVCCRYGFGVGGELGQTLIVLQGFAHQQVQSYVECACLRDEQLLACNGTCTSGAHAAASANTYWLPCVIRWELGESKEIMLTECVYVYVCVGEYPMASSSAAERSQADAELRHRRGEQVVMVFSGQVRVRLHPMPSGLYISAAWAGWALQRTDLHPVDGGCGYTNGRGVHAAGVDCLLQFAVCNEELAAL